MGEACVSCCLMHEGPVWSGTLLRGRVAFPFNICVRSMSTYGDQTCFLPCTVLSWDEIEILDDDIMVSPGSLMWSCGRETATVEWKDGFCSCFLAVWSLSHSGEHWIGGEGYKKTCYILIFERTYVPGKDSRCSECIQNMFVFICLPQSPQCYSCPF